jgi:hypothetical protein
LIRFSTRDVEGQEAVVPIVAVEEAPILLSVDRVVRGVRIYDDLPRRVWVRLEEEIDQQPIQTHGIVGDPVIALEFEGQGRLLESIQRALARQGATAVTRPDPVLTQRIGLAHQHGEQGIPAKLVVGVQVLVSEGQSVDPLGDQAQDGVLGELGPTGVGEAGGDPLYHPGGGDRLTQKKPRTPRMHREERLSPITNSGRSLRGLAGRVTPRG